ncbi:MAG: hypothetical protein KJ820_16425 [Bacteroidetes bacterium]|nr:hypothetical protein [Bacteroidota bacterium]
MKKEKQEMAKDVGNLTLYEALDLFNKIGESHYIGSVKAIMYKLGQVVQNIKVQNEPKVKMRFIGKSFTDSHVDVKTGDVVMVPKSHSDSLLHDFKDKWQIVKEEKA